MKFGTLPAKTSIVNADGILITDSADSNRVKYLSGENLKKVLAAIKNLEDAAPVSMDFSDGSTRATLSTANSRELDFTAAGLYDMQVVTVRIKNTAGGSITPTLKTTTTNDGRFGADFTALPAIATGKTAYLTFIYNDPDDRWDYLGDTKGF